MKRKNYVKDYINLKIEKISKKRQKNIQNKTPKQILSRIDEFLKFCLKTMVEFKHSKYDLDLTNVV